MKVVYPEGAGQAQPREYPMPEIKVLPHGVDTMVYRPLKNRMEVRRKLWNQNWLTDDDFLIVNVNQNQRRKDVSRSLQIVAELKKMGVPAKLVMHMQESSNDRLSLELVAEDLGLVLGQDWGHHGWAFHGSNSLWPEDKLVELYNAADLYLSTSLGEGWGLGITEALACGCPVAIPDHTSCAEIADGVSQRGQGDKVILLPTERQPLYIANDNTRPRLRVDVDKAVMAIAKHYEERRVAPKGDRLGLNGQVREWLSWDRIAGEFYRLMNGLKPLKKVLVLCDSPTMTTGFGRVIQNLAKRWNHKGVVVDCWGIGYKGWKYRTVPYIHELFPGGDGGEWCTAPALSLFCAQLQVGSEGQPYSHVWILQDTFCLSPNGFPKALKGVCQSKDIKSCLYFPVDAPVDPMWTEIISAVDLPVAYTEYGKVEAMKKLKVLEREDTPSPQPSPPGEGEPLQASAPPENVVELKA